MTRRLHAISRTGARRAVPATALSLALGATLAACGTSNSGGTGAAQGGGTGSAGTSDGVSASGAGTAAGDKVQVVASFYPLEYLVRRIGGETVQVTGLTTPGAEPHDLELTPQQVADTGKATLLVYEKGFQPAVDDAVAEATPENVLDVATVAKLDLTAPAEGGDQQAGADPHFWLDPVRYAAVATAVGDELKKLDAANASTYQANLDALTKELSALDTEFANGLKTCTNRTIVTGHAAFGYLAQRYHLTQKAIAGIDPEAEPDPKALADLATYAKAQKVTTVYAETLVSPALAKTVASETGAKVAVLDPVEGVTETSAGHDYPSIMRANLATLRSGQGCL